MLQVKYQYIDTCIKQNEVQLNVLNKTIIKNKIKCIMVIIIRKITKK